MNLDDCYALEHIIMYTLINNRTNKNLIPGEVVSAIINGTEEILEELRQMGDWNIFVWRRNNCRCRRSGQTIIVDSTVVTRIRRDEIISTIILKRET